MAKKRKQARTQQGADGESIPEEEQWRIIEQTGVLKNIPRKPSPQIPQRTQSIDDSDDDYGISFCDELFNSALLVIPFSSLYIMMDMYVCFQQI